MQKYLISIIMPVLNGMPYFREALTSVLNQSMKEMEIIVVDAGSNDGTRELVTEWQSRDARISLLHADKKSMGYQYNIGIAKATGHYIAFCESDDYLEKDMMERLYNIALQYGWPQVVKSDFEMFVTKKSGEISQPYHVYSSKNRDLYGKVITISECPALFMRDVNIWNGIYRNDFIKDKSIEMNETDGAAFQDAGFIQQVLMLADSLLYLKGKSYHYRRDNEYSSLFKKNTAQFALQEFEYMLNFFLGHKELSKDNFYLLLSRNVALLAAMYAKSLIFGSTIPNEDDVSSLRAKLRSCLKLYPDVICTQGDIAQLIFALCDNYDDFLALLRARGRYDAYKLISFFDKVKKYKHICVFGAGEYGTSVIAMLINNDIPIELCLCDNSIGLIGNKVMGVEIISPKSACASGGLFIVTSRKGMEEQLLNMHVQPNDIVFHPGIGPHASFEINQLAYESLNIRICL